MKAGYGKQRRMAKTDLWESKYFVKDAKGAMRKDAKRTLRRARRRAERQGEEPK